MILDALGALLIIGVIAVLGVLPRRLSNGAGEALGRLLYHAVPRWRRVALTNLRHVYGGPVKGPAQAVFSHLGRSFAEISRLILGRRDPLDGFRVEGYEHLQNAVDAGKGVLVITGHCGNWELVPRFLASGRRCTTVARRLKNPFLEKLLGWFRVRSGNRVIRKEGALKTVLGELRQGNIVGMLIDQGVVPSEGVKIDFLGHPAWVMKIPALVALKTGATVIPVFAHRRSDGGHTVEIRKPVEIPRTGETERDVLEATIRLSAEIEKYVRRYPDQWLWIHRRWKRAAEEAWSVETANGNR